MSGFLLAAVVPMLVVTLLVLMVNHANTRAAVEKQNMQVARTVAVAVANFLHEPVDVLEGTKNLVRMRGYAADEFAAIVGSVIIPDHYFSSVMVLNRQGKVIAFWSAGNPGRARPELLGKDFPAADYVRQAREKGRLVWSDTFISASTGEPSINLCLPWEEGLVIGEIPLAGLSRIVKQTRMSPTSYAYLVNRHGRIIAHPDISLVRQQSSASSLIVVRQGLQGKFGTYTDDVNGKREIGSVLGIAETGWLVVVSQNESEVFGFLRKTELLMLVGLTVAFAVALGLSLLVVARITRPLGQLQAHSQLLAAGDYDIAPIPADYQEISLLSDSFHAMAHAVRQREHELKDRNEELAMVEEELRQQLDEYLKSQDELLSEKNKLETILACMGDGLSIQDREFRVILQNEYHRRIIGEAYGKFCYEVYEKSDRVCDNCPVASAYADGQVHTLERRVSMDDGDHYFEITASPLRDGTGTIVAGIELVREITGRRRTEEEVRRLNDELEQRVLERTRELSDANQSLQEEIRQRA
ncbi:MAG: PAS domain-containing protein, partial [Geobacter sp.]|nr:PAS domain-containing protein [Geobacter sp.]